MLSLAKYVPQLRALAKRRLNNNSEIHAAAASAGPPLAVCSGSFQATAVR